MSSYVSPTTMLDPGRLSLHLPRLTRIATRMTGSRDAGEDLVQDTLERILRSPRRVAGDEFRYLVRSLRNSHVDRIRAENRRVRTAVMDETMEAVLPAPDHTETRTAAHEVLAAEGLTNREIAEALYVTARTVEGHLTSVFRKLAVPSREALPDALAGAPG